MDSCFCFDGDLRHIHQSECTLCYDFHRQRFIFLLRSWGSRQTLSRDIITCRYHVEKLIDVMEKYLSLVKGSESKVEGRRHRSHDGVHEWKKRSSR